MVEWRHRIEEMGNCAEPSRDRLCGLIAGGVGVASGNHHPSFNEFGNHSERSGKLRSHGNHGDSRAFRPAIDHTLMRRKTVLKIVCSAFLRVEHGPFQMQAKRLGSHIATWPVVQRFDGRRGCCCRRRNDRRQECSHTVAGQHSTKLPDQLGVIAEVDAISAVDLDIDESGGHGETGCIDIRIGHCGTN